MVRRLIVHVDAGFRNMGILVLRDTFASMGLEVILCLQRTGVLILKVQDGTQIDEIRQVPGVISVSGKPDDISVTEVLQSI